MQTTRVGDKRKSSREHSTSRSKSKEYHDYPSKRYKTSTSTRSYESNKHDNNYKGYKTNKPPSSLTTSTVDEQSQIEKLQQLLEEANKECKKWKSLFPIIRNDNNKKNNKEENNSNESDLSKAKTEIASIKKKHKELSAENDKLHFELKSKSQQIDELKLHCTTLEDTFKSDLIGCINNNKPVTALGKGKIYQNYIDGAFYYQYKAQKKELEETKIQLANCKQDLQAHEFTPNSNTGKKLITKCRILMEENEEFGREVSEGRIHQLECELSLQREFSNELQRTLNECKQYIEQQEIEGKQIQKELYKFQQEKEAYKTG